jgi:hypothetical protein
MIRWQQCPVVVQSIHTDNALTVTLLTETMDIAPTLLFKTLVFAEVIKETP